MPSGKGPAVNPVRDGVGLGEMGGRLLGAALLAAAGVIWLAAGCDAGADGIRAVKEIGRAAGELVEMERGIAPAQPGGGDRGVMSSPAAAVVIRRLEGLEVAARGSGVDYDRGDWRHWVDADRDCQNTRAEVLIAESRAAVTFADDEECRVTGGEWAGPWSGEVFSDAGEVDIDHHVPLAHAHESGGWRWDKARKRAYANDLSDPASLQVTKASVNRAKGKQAPDQWRPAERAGWCRYADDWVSVKAQWGLTVTEAEADALREMLETCGAADSWGPEGQG